MSQDLIIYMATHNEKCSHINEEDYIVPIQVGKALTNTKFEKVTDDTGDNISVKNPNYCELTALYWIWKNVNCKSVGLCHYRRKFDGTKEKILEKLNQGYIVVPKKKLFKISIKGQYIKEHNEADWNVLMNVLREKYPEYYSYGNRVFNNNVLYRFNMFIMSKSMFDNYCDWLFTILFEAENRIKKDNYDKYQNRFSGFMSERLFTLYILYNNFKLSEVNIIFKEKRVRCEEGKNVINNIIFRSKSLIRKIRRKKYEFTNNTIS